MTTYDVTGIGNAIVDVLASCEDKFLTDYIIEKGSMTLIDQERANELSDAASNATLASGGSAANTMAGFASFGGQGAYIGLVANDKLGDDFVHDAQAIGMHFQTPRHTGIEDTARSFIFITPDGERSMNTFLGACTELSVDHIDADLIAHSKVTYMEGYLFDKDPAKAAFYKAAEIAHKAGQEVALTLSDSFCVERHRDDFLKLIEGDVNILFANEAELKSLFQTDDFEDAFEKASNLSSIVVATRSENGAVISNNKQRIEIDAQPVAKIMDLTGAGDQFAAGFLYGYTQKIPIKECAILGAKAAAEVIGHIGPRPQISYKDLVA
jgi:sugar/nucleoside kinase (ribokinase family)